ncbi:hypothetical protein J2X97_000427 [Epilithonimonas hungarica]|uniref:hypothetical protein n=1 Tax=Epilithonimonas hungarica TaxID=454006 RepID=UPI0027809B18|nr:hypothetical protein [Epilithonimonas hungarica]MDP9954790.1 hypothetical protein [Epilithonimonas hungarica]
MKKNLGLLLFLFCINFGFSQKLDFKLLDQLTELSFVSIDEYMTEGYGFRILESKARERTYVRNYNNDFDNAIIITVLRPENQKNILDIVIAKNYNVREIKDNLLSRGYEYNGNNGYGFIVYKKEKSTYLISKEPNKTGATQIMVFTEW